MRKAPIVQQASEVVADCMDDIVSVFKPGVKITVLVRTPGLPDRDFCMTSEADLADAIEMLQRRKTAEQEPR